jgi:hypothetical protein
MESIEPVFVDVLSLEEPRYISVGIATGYWLDDRGSIPGMS